jgi:type I restriction enzyme R subunit
MVDHSTEADARIVIDGLLRKAGWDPTDNYQVKTEVYISGDPFPSQPTGETIEEHSTIDAIHEGIIEGKEGFPSGRADYVLFDSRGQPLAVVEAKKRAINPYVAKQQVLPYAKHIDAPFIFLTNGELIYFWDYKNDDARIVVSFYSQRDLERIVEMRENRQPLATIEIPEYFSRRGETLELRSYQKEVMQAMDHAFELGKRHFLLELPTGTGKTDLACLYLKRLFDAQWIERVAVLVDREQLARQFEGAVNDLLGQYSSYWLKAGMVRQEKQITICLLQTMISRSTEFTSGYFDVVIMDECHRSIYGAWQTALTRFDAIHIGLTATPSNYIERNTYEFYHCKPGQPDFVYDIRDAIKEGYLSPFKFATGITELIAEGAEIDEEHYDPAEFERKWTNVKTNKLMMEEFDKLAWANYKDLAPGQDPGPGKAIVFAITKHHAARLTQYLNELHPELKGRYAEVITSDIADPGDAIKCFKQETYPMVAVSVGMLDTGFDCREVLHLVMCRPVRSPILYLQMRGRGTRTCDKIGKRMFVIYDFFRNHEYFNDTDTDVFAGQRGWEYAPGRRRTQLMTPKELVELGLSDEWLEAVTYVEYGPDGERLDKKEYITNWEITIRAQVEEDPILKKIRNDETLTETEEEKLREKLNSPEYFFNEENLRHAYRDFSKSLIDFVRVALGLARVKTREERIEENFRAWLVSKSLTPEQAEYLSLLKNRGIATGKIEMGDLFKPPLSILNAGRLGVELFGEDGLREIVDEMNEMVTQAAVS